MTTEKALGTMRCPVGASVSHPDDGSKITDESTVEKAGKTVKVKRCAKKAKVFTHGEYTIVVKCPDHGETFANPAIWKSQIEKEENAMADPVVVPKAKVVDPAVVAFLKTSAPADSSRATKDLNAALVQVNEELARLNQDLKILALNDDQTEGYHAHIKMALEKKAAIVAQAGKLGVTLT